MHLSVVQRFVFLAATWSTAIAISPTSAGEHRFTSIQYIVNSLTDFRLFSAWLCC